MHPFNEGDIVVLKTGTAPQRVLQTGRHNSEYAVRAQYLNDDNNAYGTAHRWRAASDFNLYEADEPATETKTMADLYQTKTGEALFGTLLARNSLGRLVLEIKGTGQVRDFDPSEVEIVRPYTIRVKYPHTGQTVHMTAVKGSVAAGDLILNATGFILVEAIDTKSSKPAGKLTGRKVVTEALAEVADEGDTAAEVEG